MTISEVLKIATVGSLIRRPSWGGGYCLTVSATGSIVGADGNCRDTKVGYGLANVDLMADDWYIAPMVTSHDLRDGDVFRMGNVTYIKHNGKYIRYDIVELSNINHPAAKIVRISSTD